MNIGKILIFIGLGLLLIGLICLGLSKAGINLGKLPGDLYIKKEKFGVYFPIVTSIIVSIFLTVIINLVLWIFRK